MPTTPIAKKIVEKLQEKGHIAYFAGGWVRDYLMKHPSDDIDIATSASSEEVIALFPKTVPVGISFGIVVVVEQGHPFEVATFRKEGGYTDGRRPTIIERASAEEDAQRRDFTINGMFFDPIREELFDFVGGRKDLDKGIIRAIGNARERFQEDRLRMMRAVRYSTRFNFPIESDTLQAILKLAPSLLPAVAHERIWQEFKKMSQFAHFDTGLVTLHRLGLLQTIFPQLSSVSVEQLQQRVEPIASYPKNAPTIAELLELFPSSSLAEHMQICQYLKVCSEDKEFIRHLHKVEGLVASEEKRLGAPELADWARVYADDRTKTTLEILSARLPQERKEPFIHEHTMRMQRLEQDILRIHSKSPIIRSEHLIQEGIKPGVCMGLLLKEAERISINESLQIREDILSKLKKSPLWQSDSS